MADQPPPMPNKPPEQKAPTMAKEPPSGMKFPCVKCGARLDFDPHARSLQCPYCGHKEEIKQGEAKSGENDLEEYLARQEGTTVVAGRKYEVKCQTCAAVVLLEDKVAASRCPYCATFLESKVEEAKAMIQPESVLPFAVDKRKAGEAFKQWVGGLWFAPTELKQWADRGQINGVYIPFWTYDSMTYTFYTGSRGDDIHTTETYTEYESYQEDGETQSRAVEKTRTITTTIWTPVAGEIQYFFDDVLVCASHSIPDYYLNIIQPKELGDLVEFKPDFLSGFVTERYTVGLKDGWDKARGIMDTEVREMCRRDIGGDHQQLVTVETQHVGVTFKHVLLPVYLSSYMYRDKTYRVLINGLTGQVTGERPYSFWKIAGLVLAIVLILALLIGGIVFLVQGSKTNRKSEKRDSGSLVVIKDYDPVKRSAHRLHYRQQSTVLPTQESPCPPNRA